MAISRFERFHSATNLVLSRITKLLPILLRAGLLFLFIWYGVELTGVGAIPPLVVGLVLFLLVFLLVFGIPILVTSKAAKEANDAAASSSTTPLWPFLLINLLMILLVSAILKWERGRGSEEVTRGLLGFTWYWVQKIGVLFTGGR